MGIKVDCTSSSHMEVARLKPQRRLRLAVYVLRSIVNNYEMIPYRFGCENPEV